MTQIPRTVHERVDFILDLLTWQWGRLPEVEAEIDHWDLMEQLDFIEEWPLEEDRLARLEGYIREGLLTADQHTRYEDLKQLIVRNRPIIRRLQES